MRLSEAKRMEYEQIFYDNQPEITQLDLRKPDKTVLSFAVGLSSNRLVVKFATTAGQETLSLNPIAAHYLWMNVLKGVKAGGGRDVDVQVSGQPTTH